MEALLINRDDVMKLTGLSGNIDSSKILPHVKTAQDIHLQPVIGTDLLNKLKQDVTDDTLTGDYQTLVETYITPMLVFYTMTDFLPFLLFEVSNGGVFRHTPENSVTAEKSEMESMVQKFKDKGAFYSSRLNDYLCDNTDLFPEYSTNSGSDLNSGADLTFNGWVL